MKLDEDFSKQAVAAMRQSVRQALQIKQKLGQYAVIYADKKIQRIEAKDIKINNEGYSTPTEYPNGPP